MLKVNFDNGRSIGMVDFRFKTTKKSPLDKFTKLKIPPGKRLRTYDQGVFDTLYYVDRDYNIIESTVGEYTDIRAELIEIDCSVSILDKRFHQRDPYELYESASMKFTQVMNKLSYKLSKHCSDKICKLMYVTHEDPCVMAPIKDRDRNYSIHVMHNLYLFAMIRTPLEDDSLESNIKMWKEYEERTGRHYYGVDDYVRSGYWDWWRWKYGDIKIKTV